MKYAKIIKYDTGNWEGINTTIFFSGCHFHCRGCFNEVAQDFNYGTEFNRETIEDFITKAKDEHVVGVNILGGEPFDQDLDVMYNFIKEVRERVGKPIHFWSGYLYEEIMKDEKKARILRLVDTLVDGQFMLDKKDLRLRFRGSSNQRVIDVGKSVTYGYVKLID